MLLFRSEEHIEKWRRPRGIDRGATLSLGQQWRLARRWYRERMSPEWRRFTIDEAEQVFADVGLTGPFWSLRAG